MRLADCTALVTVGSASGGKWSLGTPILKPCQEDFEYSRVDRPYKLNAAPSPIDPANSRFNRIESIEFDPENFVRPWPLNKLYLATSGCQIEDRSLIMRSSAAPKR